MKEGKKRNEVKERRKGTKEKNEGKEIRKQT